MPPAAASSSPVVSVSVPSRQRSELPGLPRSDDPTVYARAVAVALFDVDTLRVSRDEFLLFWQGELPSVVYSDGAARGLTLAGQDADAMDNLTRWWVPSAAVWVSEAADATVSRLRILSVSGRITG
jgi:hypothetical protein